MPQYARRRMIAMSKIKLDNVTEEDSNKKLPTKLPGKSVEAFSVSENTLNMMDSSMENLKASKSGKAIYFER